MNILFVCTGNTCRSPMAEAILKSITDRFKVQSAGIYASFGSPFSNGTKEVLSDVGIRAEHESQLITEGLIDWADIVLTMTHKHKQLLMQDFPSKKDKYFTLKEYNIKYKERALNQYSFALKRLKTKQDLFQEPKEGFDTALEKEVVITEYVKKELAEVQKAKHKLNKEDIQDPFGQSKAGYQATYDELIIELNKLIKNKKEDNDESNCDR